MTDDDMCDRSPTFRSRPAGVEGASSCPTRTLHEVDLASPGTDV
jgi:hypothetical protein